MNKPVDPKPPSVRTGKKLKRKFIVNFRLWMETNSSKLHSSFNSMSKFLVEILHLRLVYTFQYLFKLFIKTINFKPKKGTSSKSASESEPTTATNDAILVFAFINCPSFYPFVSYVIILRNDEMKFYY